MSHENPYAATAVSNEPCLSGETRLVVRGRSWCRLLCVALLVTQLGRLTVGSLPMVGILIVVWLAYCLREGTVFGRYGAAAVFGFDGVSLGLACATVVRTGQEPGMTAIFAGYTGLFSVIAIAAAAVTCFSPSITAYVKHVAATRLLAAEDVEPSSNRPSVPTHEECPWCDVMVVRTDGNRCPACDRPI